jgi:hypothetical protein
MSDTAPFPQPLATDLEDVAWALSTAQAMWARGERADALKWVKRASEAAEEAGDDDRAFALARQVAELKDAAGSMAPPPPPPPPPEPPYQEAPARPATGARGTAVMQAVSATPAPRPPSPRPTAGTPATPVPPAATQGPMPTAGTGFRPRPPGAPAPTAGAPTAGARPGTSPARPTPGTVRPPSPSLSERPPAPTRTVTSRPETSSTEVMPFPAPATNDPDDWPTHALSGEDEIPSPPQLINEGQHTIASCPSTPAQLYTPAPAPPAPPTPASPAAPLAPPVPSAPTPGTLSSHNVWIFSTPQGLQVRPATAPRPEGATEAVLVGNAELQRLLG